MRSKDALYFCGLSIGEAEENLGAHEKTGISAPHTTVMQARLLYARTTAGERNEALARRIHVDAELTENKLDVELSRHLASRGQTKLSGLPLHDRAHG